MSHMHIYCPIGKWLAVFWICVQGYLDVFFVHSAYKHNDQICMYKFRTKCLISWYHAMEQRMICALRLGLTCNAAPPTQLVLLEPYSDDL